MAEFQMTPPIVQSELFSTATALNMHPLISLAICQCSSGACPAARHCGLLKEYTWAYTISCHSLVWLTRRSHPDGALLPFGTLRDSVGMPSPASAVTCNAEVSEAAPVSL